MANRGARLAGFLGVFLLAASSLSAQVGAPAPPPPDVRNTQANRADLEALLAQVRPGQENLLEARILRERLTEGDFQVGDRIVLQVLEDSSLADTFAVQTGRILQLPSLPDISLRGVLRSELRDYLAAEIGKYVRNPTVRARAMMRLAVLGEVGQPGYYHVAADMLLSDAIMAAGGPSGTADTRRIAVRRGTTELYHGEVVQNAIAAGRTLDMMNLRGGDEIYLEPTRQRNWESTLRTITVIVGLPLTIFGLTRLF